MCSNSRDKGNILDHGTSSLLLLLQTPQLNNKEDLIRGLQQERRAAEAAAAAKKKLEEQRLLVRFDLLTIFSTSFFTRPKRIKLVALQSPPRNS